jgi:hypothetical protein
MDVALAVPRAHSTCCMNGRKQQAQKTYCYRDHIFRLFVNKVVEC